jgi:hypothetical protein
MKHVSPCGPSVFSGLPIAIEGLARPSEAATPAQTGPGGGVGQDRGRAGSKLPGGTAKRSLTVSARARE